ncbi:MAG TPA: serine protease [Pseudonocardiaceae bacterium]
MSRRLLGAFAAALTGATLLAVGAPAVAAPTAPPAPAVVVDFTGIVALSNCSGALVRPANAALTDPAMVMTNGHCVKFMATNEVIVNQTSTRTFSLLDPTGSRTVATLRATHLAYATMSGTDVALYRLSQSYSQIQTATGIRALDLATTHPVAGTDIRVVSGYWKRIYTCRIEAFVYSVREYNWTWRDSIRYASSSSCQTIGGTSGSPIVDVATGRVVGVNNTSNEDGGRCTLNNPCEVSSTGAVTVRPGARYGQQTYQVNACLGAGNTVTLTAPGCTLARP